MTSVQKYVNALFMAAAAVVWLIASHYTEVVVGYFQLGRTLGGSVDVILHGLPLLLAASTFFFLRKSHTTANFATDAITELIRVSWPTKRDIIIGTIVVIITVIVAGISLGILDKLLIGLIRTIIGA